MTDRLMTVREGDEPVIDDRLRDGDVVQSVVPDLELDLARPQDRALDRELLLRRGPVRFADPGAAEREEEPEHEREERERHEPVEPEPRSAYRRALERLSPGRH